MSRALLSTQQSAPHKSAVLVAVIVLQAALGGCATQEQHALGKILRGGDVPVYQSDIKAKYVVVKELSEMRQQICGPNYYDDFAGAAWMAAAATAAGANAVINYRSTNTGLSLTSCGTFQVMATAVKIEQFATAGGQQ